MIHYPSVSSDRLAEGDQNTTAKVFDSIYLKQPEVCVYFFDRKSMETGEGDLYTTADEKDLVPRHLGCDCLDPVDKETTSPEDNDEDVVSVFERALRIDDKV